MAIVLHQDRPSALAHGVGALHAVPVLYYEHDDPAAIGGSLFIEPAYAYLRAKALGTWVRQALAGDYDFATKPSSANSLKTYADHLSNFFSWCRRYRVDWKTATYADLLEDYQARMVSGEWSNTGKPLAGSTINQRMTRIIDFLVFAGEAGYRLAFVPMMTVAPRSATFSGKVRRAGAVRIDDAHIDIPTIASVQQWLDAFRADQSRAQHLMARTALETGMRREEVTSFRASQLPTLAAIAGQASYPIRIEFGTKGQRILGDPEKRGKPRTVHFPVRLLEELIRYRDTLRRKILADLKMRRPGARAPKELFLSERTLGPYRPNTMTKAWEASRDRPNPAWTPHAARHFWACYTLIGHLEPVFAERSAAGGSIPQSELLASIEHIIATEIRDALGHVSTDTTYQYLRWISSYYRLQAPVLTPSDMLHG